MGATSLTGKDVVMIDGRIISDLANGQSANLTFSNEKAKVTVGKNGNAVFADAGPGSMGKLTLRVLIGSADDKYLQSRMQEQDNDFSAFIPLNGEITKRVGDGAGNITNVAYQLAGGVFTKGVDAMTSADGDTDQSVAVFDITFASVKRIPR